MEAQLFSLSLRAWAQAHSSSSWEIEDVISFSKWFCSDEFSVHLFCLTMKRLIPPPVPQWLLATQFHRTTDRRVTSRLSNIQLLHKEAQSVLLWDIIKVLGSKGRSSCPKLDEVLCLGRILSWLPIRWPDKQWVKKREKESKEKVEATQDVIFSSL